MLITAHFSPFFLLFWFIGFCSKIGLLIDTLDRSRIVKQYPPSDDNHYTSMRFCHRIKWIVVAPLLDDTSPSAAKPSPTDSRFTWPRSKVEQIPLWHSSPRTS